MKTAISVPDPVFDRASRRAEQLGMSRSEFFTRAAEHYLDDLATTSVTEQIDQALGRRTGVDESTIAAVERGRRTLAEQTDEW